MSIIKHTAGASAATVLMFDSFFLKWIEAYTVPNIEAKTIVEKLVMEVISHFGVPVQIKSDRGKQFDFDFFRNMCQLLDIEDKMSTAFHPQGTFQVDRMVKVIGT